MRAGLTLLCLTIAACTATVPRATTADTTASALPSAISRRELVPGVWIVTHEKPWPANSLLYRTLGGAYVLVGTPYTPEATAALLNSLEAEASITAINPHFHYDAAGGNAALVARGIPVYGSDRTVELMRTRGPQVNEETAAALKDDPDRAAIFRNFKFVPPTRVF